MVLPPDVNSQPNSTPFSGFTFPSNSIDLGKAFRHPQLEFEPFGSSSSGTFGQARRSFSCSSFSFDSSNGTSGQVKQSPFGKSNTEIFGQAPGTSNSWGAFGSSTAVLGSTDASPSSCGACTTVGSFKQQGSCLYPFTPTEDKRENDFAISPKLLMSISAMTANCNKSHEELRLEDYEKGNKGKISTSPFQPASSQAPCSLFGSPFSEPPRSQFQPASSQAPCSLFGSPSRVPPRSPFQSASSQAPGGSLFGPPSREPPRSPFQSASSQAPGGSLFGPPSREPHCSPFKFGFGKTTSTSQHGFQSTGICSSIPEAASNGVRFCNCKCNQANALARINPAAFPVVHANTSEATQGTNTFISYPAFVTFIHPAAAANGAHSTAFTSIASPGNPSTSSFTFGPNVGCSTPPSTSTNIATASCLFPSLSSCPSLQSPAPSFSHNTLAANQGAASEPTFFGKACLNKLKVEETNYSSRVPKGLEIIVEKLGFNPWSKGLANEQDSESKDILPCEEANKDEDIIALAEFAVEQQNALQKVKKFKFLSVVAACLEAVGGGRYHIVLDATNTRVSFMST
ncbi:nuclear pore complex protein NUP98B-like [Chenopodium quinoa]|uniref:nuclear pore complex protein NUP98B-like n=1 Tax=Chenopodium quinoa TaxID=63459 RepID=UPI000B78B1EA|nr:nuclear pore complex protein NUP98B-like [Chenopodium quinoa]